MRAREEDLLSLYVNACSDDITRFKVGPVFFPLPVGMKLLAIIAVIAIAVRFPPVQTNVPQKLQSIITSLNRDAKGT